MVLSGTTNIMAADPVELHFEKSQTESLKGFVFDSSKTNCEKTSD